jgi:hypothetical protein
MRILHTMLRVGDLKRSQEKLRFFSKQLPHLACRSKVIALGLISQPVRIAKCLSRTYAEQSIVRLVIGWE